MSIDNLLKPISGIRPFNQLAIDADIWREAHEHHHAHRRMHAAAHHRPGIIYGLEVFVSSSKVQTLVVAPGVGLDAEGRTLLLTEPVTFTLDQRGETVILIAYQEALDRLSRTPVADGEQYFRVFESRKVEATQVLPKQCFLELARVDRSGANKPIKNAANPFDPDLDELNLMHRVHAFPHCYADGEIGDICLLPEDNTQDWKPNRAGLWNLIQEANRTGCHLAFSGLFGLRTEAVDPGPILLYTAGSSSYHSPSQEELDGMDRFLASGGTVFAEDCGTGDIFAKQFNEMVKARGVSLQPVAHGNPLLTSHHVFPAPPAGRRSRGSLLADLDKGVILSTFDYGGSWQGNLIEDSGRGAVRDAQEFGMNIVAWAARRQRQIALQKLN